MEESSRAKSRATEGSYGGETCRGNSQVRRGSGSECTGGNGNMEEGRQVGSGKVVNSLIG